MENTQKTVQVVRYKLTKRGENVKRIAKHIAECMWAGAVGIFFSYILVNAWFG